MFRKWNKFSYADRKSYIARVKLSVIKAAFIVFAYIIVTRVIFSMTMMESSSMQPSIKPGDRFVFFSLDLSAPADVIPFLDVFKYNRGDIVIIEMAEGRKGVFSNAADGFIRFFTGGRIGLAGKRERLFIKRIIALPGDEVSISDYVVQIRPKGSPYDFTEYELSKKLYNVSSYNMSDFGVNEESWGLSIPFSGNMNKMTLREGQYFVLSDDRSNTNDSRTWGAVNIDNIKGKTLLRYWPYHRLGIP